MEAAKWLDLSNSASPEFIARAVAALAASVAKEYGFTDVDGATPRPLTLGDV
jgi:dehydrogenase/reductase SDR family protein 1